jgi:hypothetical protein
MTALSMVLLIVMEGKEVGNSSGETIDEPTRNRG